MSRSARLHEGDPRTGADRRAPAKESGGRELWEVGLNRRGNWEFAGVSWKLWLLLGLSLAFITAVQFLDRWERSRRTQTSRVGSDMVTVSPSLPVRAGSLYLSWEEIPGAAIYFLHIETVGGNLVVDRLRVEGSAWTPPDDLLPALPAGSYRWFVQAEDEKGRSLARSQTSQLDLR